MHDTVEAQIYTHQAQESQETYRKRPPNVPGKRQQNVPETSGILDSVGANLQRFVLQLCFCFFCCFEGATIYIHISSLCG